MRRFRFSLATLLATVYLAAVACALVVSRLEQISLVVAVTVLLVAAVQLIRGDPRMRAFWIGFVLYGLAYRAFEPLVLVPTSIPLLLGCGGFGGFLVRSLYGASRKARLTVAGVTVAITGAALAVGLLYVYPARAEQQVWAHFAPGRLTVEPSGPAWLQYLLGDAFLARATKLTDSVTDSDLENIALMGKLRHLSLGGVTDPGLRHLAALTDLETLNLSWTQVSDSGLVHLTDLANLRELYLHETAVTGSGLVHLRRLTKLRRLSLSDTPLRVLPIDHLRSLEHLDLRRTTVSDAELVHLEDLKNLKQLYLNQTPVSDGGLVHLENLRNLELLSLYGTRVSDSGLAQLQVLAKLEYGSGPQKLDSGSSSLR